MNKEDLIVLIELGLSIKEVSKKLKKSETSIRYWYKKFELKSKYFTNKRIKLISRIKEEIPKCYNISDIAFKIYGVRSGNSYHLIKSLIAEHNLTTNFKKGIKPIHTKIETNKILSYDRLNGRRTNAVTLKRALKIKGVDIKKCNICGIDSWNNKPINLQVDHINGNCIDNRIDNLRVLCPNCHSQTDTFCR